MGQGHIRKGFFFYFGLFVLLLIAVFCICLVIMIFNPGKTVLWMQYFTANDHFLVTQTTDDSKTPINMNFLNNNVDTIEINCTSYAQVLVQRNRDEEFKQEGIHIINHAKGFQGANGAVHFDYNAILTGKTLTIDITEPNGFLNFSKDIKVVLATFTGNEYNNNFENINLKVNVVDGNFEVGNVGLNPKAVKLKGLTVDAKGKGSIVVGEKFDTSSLSTISLSTNEGSILSHNKIAHESKYYSGLYANCDVKLETNSGKIDLDMVKTDGKDLTINNEKGNVGIDFIKATNTNVVCKHGNYVFGTVDGNLNYAGTEDTMITPNIIVDYIAGNFALNGADKAEPDITIKKIDGNVQIFADKGKLDINEAKGEIEILSAGTFNTDIIVSDSNTNLISIETKSGKVNLSFAGVVGDAKIKTNSGKIVVNVTSTASFVANSYQNSEGIDAENQEMLGDGKINVSTELLDGTTKNPLEVDDKDGEINVYTNASVDYNLVNKTSLVVEQI